MRDSSPAVNLPKLNETDMKNSSALSHRKFVARRYCEGIWLAVKAEGEVSLVSKGDPKRHTNYMPILSTISSVLFVLWIFGVFGLFYLGSFVHLLLLAAIALAVLRVSREYNYTVNEYAHMFHARAQEIFASRVLPVLERVELRTRDMYSSVRAFFSSSIRSFSARKLKQLKV